MTSEKLANVLATEDDSVTLQGEKTKGRSSSSRAMNRRSSSNRGGESSSSCAADEMMDLDVVSTPPNGSASRPRRRKDAGQAAEGRKSAIQSSPLSETMQECEVGDSGSAVAGAMDIGNGDETTSEQEGLNEDGQLDPASRDAMGIEDGEEDDDEDDGEGQFDEEEMCEDDEDQDGEGDGDGIDGGSGGFGSHLRAMAGYMSGLTTRYRSLLESIRNRKDPSAQLAALQELSEVLSISNEDTLAGYFPSESFIGELIYLMGGPKPSASLAAKNGAGESSKSGNDRQAELEDDEMAAAIAAASGLEDNGEKMLLACRCLANLIEAMPYAAHTVVNLGAIPVLNSKLMEIEFIDLAEQVLQTLEKISNEYPSAIVAEDGLAAMLRYLDFFNIHVQRTAMSAAANCCRRLSVDQFAKFKEVKDIVLGVLSYSDQRLVESACRCIVRLIDSFRHHGEILEELLTDDLVASINAILLPATNGSSGSTSSTGAATSNTSVNTATYSDVLKALGMAARVSPKTAVTLLENNVVETLYHLLTGSPAPNEEGVGGNGPAATSVLTSDAAVAIASSDIETSGAAIAGVESQGYEATTGVADVAVLRNLAHRPKEQVQEALSLVAELLPPLPRSGVFDPRLYTEKAYLRRKSKLAKAMKQAQLGKKTASPPEAALADKEDTPEAKDMIVTTPLKVEKPKTDREVAKEIAQAKRIETLRDRKGLVKRFTQLVLPTLIEVYAASVASYVRSKALYGILKIVSFVEAEPLLQTLDNVPLASFIAAILSSRDHPALVQGALQLVELLTNKLPDVYSGLLRREGVMWEIEDIASKSRSVTSTLAKQKSGTATEEAGAEKSNPSISKKGGEGSPESSANPDNSAASTASAGDASADASAVLTTSTAKVKREAGAHVANRQVGRPWATADAASSRTLVATLPSVIAASSVAAPTMVSVHGQTVTLAEAEESNIWRARILRDLLSPSVSKASMGGAHQASHALDVIKELVEKLRISSDVNEADVKNTLQEIGALFSRTESPISSFELLRSGLIEGLYDFATQGSEHLDLSRRRLLLSEAILPQSTLEKDANTGLAALALIRRLQESLSRLEDVEITTALNNASDESRRSPTANVARQLRLKLVADNEAGDIPRSCHNIVVSIHAITSFQSLNDYLRPKISAAQAASSAGKVPGGGGAAGLLASSNLSGVLAAFASSAGLDMYPSLRDSLAASPDATSKLLGMDAKGVGSSSVANNGRLGTDTAQSQASTSSYVPQIASGQDKDKENDLHVDKPQSNAGHSKEQASKRRSMRLRGKGDSVVKDSSAPGEDLKGVSAQEASERESDMDIGIAHRLVQDLLQDEMDGLEGVDNEDGEQMYTDEDEDDEGDEDEDDVDDEIIDGDAMTGTMPAGDRTVRLDVVPDGSKVEVKTTDGTSLPTPPNGALASRSADQDTGAAAASTSSASVASPGKTSYASALQKRPTDWHLEFSMEGAPLALSSTVYSAVHRFEMGRQAKGDTVSPRYIWSNTYTIHYRKVPGPEATPEKTADAQDDSDAMVGKATSRSPTPTSLSPFVTLPDSMSDKAQYAHILQLLRVLYDLNMEWKASGEGLASAAQSSAGLPEASFVNNKLTAKLARQLEEPMIVASNCMPYWSLDLPKYFSFLFPFEVRYSFLQSTSFGYHRLINRWQNQQSRSQDSSNSSTSIAHNSRHDDSLALFARLTRQKVRISRSNILASAFKVFELYGTNSSLLEVEYFDEVGTGLGPTLEFYSLVSKEFARRSVKMWRSEDEHDKDRGEFVFARNGLFPSPIAPQERDTPSGKTKMQSFKVLGQFVAKALFDSRIVDLHFSTTFMMAATQQRVPETMAMLRAVDPPLAQSLQKLLAMDKVELSSLGLDFTLPGYSDYELHAGGLNEAVDGNNVEQYVQEVIRHTLKVGVAPLIDAFRQGFSLVFPIASMSIFTAEELVMLFGNAQEDWSEGTLIESIKPDHGYNADSPAFRNVISIMSQFSQQERRDFLQWLTGSPKLPIGGFAGLHPALTIVKRPPEANMHPDKTLPSVMTCVNFCKLPPFSTREVMKDRLLLAMKEGQASFHLS